MRQSEEVLERMKRLGGAMVLVPATIIAHRMLLNTWNGWCIVLLILIITGVSAHDPGLTQDVDS